MIDETKILITDYSNKTIIYYILLLSVAYCITKINDLFSKHLTVFNIYLSYISRKKYNKHNIK